MKQLSPVLSSAFHLLRQDIYLHLDGAELTATEPAVWSEEDIQSARALIQDLVTVVRGVVALHDTPNGTRCRTCDMAWPCQALETLHRLVKNPDGEFVKILKRMDGRR
ncbi:MAG TPA: hypothetical protein VGX25_31790 [Actinophytocola sp.]|uniref:hypothetical protein n=1 Tax=Actinophytocola sp. TaxID=1872138 RepID=UPI002DDD0FD4|nr:hypothetical protein [Actinophytocola sp.]HEV2783994.1 hypothetical protein [Actinophytocola sp.]